jgi:hypothetical protein
LPTAVLAFQHRRHLPIYAIVWISYVPAWLGPTTLGRKIEQLWNNHIRFLITFWVILGILGGAYACEKRFWALRIPTMSHEASEGATVYPVGAVAYLADNGFHGNLMVPFGTGAFVSWRLYPAVRVSIDSRYEVAYPAGTLEESVRFYRAKDDWAVTLAKYRTDAVLLPWWSPLAEPLANAPDYTGSTGWRKVYKDDAYAVYVRRGLAHHYPSIDRSVEPILGSFP